jgi:crotonobetainyl-CoA:carnitine CoA-transferase CaiB-like acyl-CoA transferase
MTEGALYGATMLFGLAEASGQWARAGRETLTGELPCYNIYLASDGLSVALAALEPKFWSAFCSAAERDDLLPFGHDPSAAAFDAVRAVFATRTRDEWAALGNAHDICLSAVLEGEAVFGDAHHQERRAFAEIKVDDRTLRLPTPPFRSLCETRFVSAPSLGADNAAVFRDLGYTPDEIAGLSRSGAVGPAAR